MSTWTATDKRDAILETALALFTERGFYGTPTAMISREAGVATGTLFFYFKTKEELIDTLYRHIKSEAAAALREGVDQERTIQAKDPQGRGECASHGGPQTRTNSGSWSSSPIPRLSPQPPMRRACPISFSCRNSSGTGYGRAVIRDYDPDFSVLCSPRPSPG